MYDYLAGLDASVLLGVHCHFVICEAAKAQARMCAGSSLTAHRCDEYQITWANPERGVSGVPSPGKIQVATDFHRSSTPRDAVGSIASRGSPQVRWWLTNVVSFPSPTEFSGFMHELPFACLKP